MLNPTKVFIIKPFPEIQICQLPSILININHFCELITKLFDESYNKCHFVNIITKQNIEDAFLRDGFHNLIVLKSDSKVHYFLNMNMVEFLELANQSKKIQDLKAFW